MVGITDSMDTSLSKLRELVTDKEAWLAANHGVAKSDRDQIHVPCFGRWVPNHWTPREVLVLFQAVISHLPAPISSTSRFCRPPWEEGLALD